MAALSCPTLRIAAESQRGSSESGVSNRVGVTLWAVCVLSGEIWILCTFRATARIFLRVRNIKNLLVTEYKMYLFIVIDTDPYELKWPLKGWQVFHKN